MSDPLNPTASLLSKLASLAVHVEELQSPSGTPDDAAAIRSLLADAEINEWISEMRKMALIPVKR